MSRMSARTLAGAVNPGLALSVGAVQRALAGVPRNANGRSVAVLGRVPGSGTSTVVAALALVAAGYTDNRVTVIDTNRSAPGGSTTATTAARLLGGSGEGRLPVLLQVPAGEQVARRRIAAAGTAGAAVPLLALPGDHGGFAPQTLENTLDRLRHRSDLTIIDTPSDRGEPVFHAALHLVDHLVLVLPADVAAPDRLTAARRWLAATPGPPLRAGLTVVLLGRELRVPRWRPPDLPWVLLRRDRALRSGRPGQLSRRSLVGVLDLLATVSRPA